MVCICLKVKVPQLTFFKETHALEAIDLLIFSPNLLDKQFFQQFNGPSTDSINNQTDLSMQKKLQEYTVAPADPKETKFFQDVQQFLDWDPLINSYLVLSQISPGGLLLGKTNGEIVSCMLALKYSKKFGFLGVYWVKPSHRGKGYGLIIFTKALQFLKDCEIIGLDSVPSQIHNFSKWGFIQCCNSSQYYVDDYESETSFRNTTIFRDYKDVGIEKVLQFDSIAFPGSNRKNELIKSFENQQVFISTKDNKVQGYAVVFRDKTGLAISPLYSLTEQAASDIINQIFDHYKDSKQRIIAYVFDEYERISTFMKKRFPITGYNCRRMYLRTASFTKDFDRSCVYSFNSYDRG